MFACTHTGWSAVFRTLQYEAAANSEALRGVVSLGSCRGACQCQKDSRLADKLEWSATWQKQPLVLDEGRPATKLYPSSPALQLKAAALRHDEEKVWSLRRLQGHHRDTWRRRMRVNAPPLERTIVNNSVNADAHVMSCPSAGLLWSWSWTESLGQATAQVSLLPEETQSRWCDSLQACCHYRQHSPRQMGHCLALWRERDGRVSVIAIWKQIST